jgi:transmembrane sensor
MHTQTPATDDIAAQAADWIVRLTGDDEADCADARIGFEQWKQADVRHAQAADRLQSVIDRMNAVRTTTPGHTQPAYTAIHSAISRYKTTRRIKKGSMALLLACACVLPAWMVMQTHTAAYLMADMHTATGQRQVQSLSDGSTMTLGSKSAVNVHFDHATRRIDLVAGEILVDVAKDASRPFVVQTDEATMRALGTRFVVEREEGVTILTMLESTVLLKTAAQQANGVEQGTIVRAGEQIRITATSSSPAQTIDIRSVSDSWQFGQVVIMNKPLTDVLDTLAKYRPGYLHYDRQQLAGITMSVVLPIEDTDQALQLIANSLPDLRIRTLTPYLVYVDRAAENKE